VKKPHKAIEASRGFSLIELMVVIGIILILLGAGIPKILSTMKEARARQAFEAVLTQMRLGREIAVDRRRVMKLTFNKAVGSTPANIVSLAEDVVIDPVTLKHTYQAVPGTNNPLTTTLPSDMDFMLPASVPKISPDTLGTTPSPIDYGYNSSSTGGQNVMYFQANGQVLQNTENGPVADGVIYVGRTGDPTSNRAVSILGMTGRIKGWHLMTSISSPQCTSPPCWLQN